METLYNAILSILEGVLSALPDMPANTVDIADVADFAAKAGAFIDVTALKNVLTVIIGYEGTMVAVRVALWIYKILPFT